MTLQEYTAQTESSYPLPPSLVDPKVWDTHTPSVAKCSPVLIHLKDSTSYSAQAQYPLPQRGLIGLQPIIQNIRQKGFLCPANSPYNTPILAVRKPNGSYLLVQDLHIINSVVAPILPIVSNPYTLLSSIPSSTTYFSVLDLKDVFFTIPLHPDS